MCEMRGKGQSIKLYGHKVFLSWQSGLEDVREHFYKTVWNYNQKFAINRGFVFIPTDWQNIPVGCGTDTRTQDVINRELKGCDYLILTFWNRCGSPSEKGDEKSSSRTEEEYDKALEYCSDKNVPMAGVAVFFRKVSTTQMADPGEQLRILLALKEKVAKSRLYKEFDSLGEFEKLVTEQLESWLQNLGEHYREKRTVEETTVHSFSEPPDA